MVLLDVDMHNVTSAQLFDWKRTIRLQQASKANPVFGLCGWFDVMSCGHNKAPAQACLNLTTSPMAKQPHWGHTAVLLSPPIESPEVVVQLRQSANMKQNLSLTLQYGETSASYSI